jgi:hypothetical protein
MAKRANTKSKATKLSGELIKISEWQPWYPVASELTSKVLKIKHGDKVKFEGRYYTAGSVVGYAIERGDDPVDCLLLAVSRHNITHWFNLDCTVLCANDVLRTQYQAERDAAIEVTCQQVINFEGRYCAIGRAPNNNVSLYRLSPAEVAALALELTDKV